VLVKFGTSRHASHESENGRSRRSNRLSLEYLRCACSLLFQRSCIVLHRIALYCIVLYRIVGIVCYCISFRQLSALFVSVLFCFVCIACIVPVLAVVCRTLQFSACALFFGTVLTGMQDLHVPLSWLPLLLTLPFVGVMQGSTPGVLQVFLSI
jgi:hypothetical protein